MKKILFSLLGLILLSSCGVKRNVLIDKKKFKEQQEELLKEERIKKIEFIKNFYLKELSDLSLLKKGQLSQDQYFKSLTENIIAKKDVKELQDSIFWSFFKTKETPFNNYKDFLEDNIRFLSLTKPYFYLQEEDIQKEIDYLLRNLIHLQKIVIIIPELSYEKRK
jgi:Icc-related predicted phosphoesterase